VTNTNKAHFAVIKPGELLKQYSRFHEDLGQDEYHPKEIGGRTRRLAQHYMTYDQKSEVIKITRLKTQPFLQGEYNKLTGSIERPFEDHFPETDMKPFIRYGFGEIISRWPNEKNENEWLVNCHLIRTHAFEGQVGNPAPEGIHRDGVEYIIMGCVGVKNISGATSTLYRDESANSNIYTYTLMPGEALLVNDRELMHGVSPVIAEDNPAYRDMILMGFHYWRRNHYRADWKESLHDFVKPEHVA
jgi:hypothetical protein